MREADQGRARGGEAKLVLRSRKSSRPSWSGGTKMIPLLQEGPSADGIKTPLAEL